MKTVFISAGDISGDNYAAALMREMLKREPDIVFHGYGLESMLDAGLETPDTQSAPAGAMWLHNVLATGKFRSRLALAKEVFRNTPPDLLILVDYGGFNLYLAREAAKEKIPVLYYILPQAWAHGRYRLKKIRKWVHRAAVIYPFEPDICRIYGVDAHYVGHPFFDELNLNPPSQENVEKLTGQHGEGLIAVFPGSRSQEINANLPIILEACKLLQKNHRDIKFLAACPTVVQKETSAIVENSGVDLDLSSARPVELARAARLCITKSGTITLEIASQHTPMIILYKTNPLLYFLISGMTHTPYAGIINVLAGEMICPEKVMWRPDFFWVYRQAVRLLEDENRYKETRSSIKSVLERIGTPGATERTADIAMEMMNL